METTTDSDPRAALFTGSDATIPCLTIAHAPDPSVVGARRAVRPGAPLVLGRGATTSFPGVFRGGSTSRNHCRVGYAPSRRITLTDLASRNGTYVNNRRVDEVIPLEPGDVIAVGDTVLLFHCVQERLTPPNHPRLRGVSDPIASTLEQVRLVAARDTPTLLVGETGTGKELVAQELHALSGRPGPLVSLNCAGVTDSLLASELFGHARGAFTGAERDRKGLLETAKSGTFFLDELTDASPSFQASLLRLFETGEYRRVGSDRVLKAEVRFVSAVQPRVHDMVASHEFRLDLWTRLAQWVIPLAPLSERVEDIPLLARHFAKSVAGDDLVFEPQLIVALMQHPWPGNIRELRAAIERLVVSSVDGVLTWASFAKLHALERHADPHVGEKPASKSPSVSTARSEKASKADTVATLEKSNGNVRAAAAMLGVTRKTLYRWMESMEVDPAEFRSP